MEERPFRGGGAGPAPTGIPSVSAANGNSTGLGQQARGLSRSQSWASSCGPGPSFGGGAPGSGSVDRQERHRHPAWSPPPSAFSAGGPGGPGGHGASGLGIGLERIELPTERAPPAPASAKDSPPPLGPDTSDKRREALRAWIEDLVDGRVHRAVRAYKQGEFSELVFEVRREASVGAAAATEAARRAAEEARRQLEAQAQSLFTMLSTNASERATTCSSTPPKSKKGSRRRTPSPNSHGTAVVNAAGSIGASGTVVAGRGQGLEGQGTLPSSPGSARASSAVIGGARRGVQEAAVVMASAREIVEDVERCRVELSEGFQQLRSEAASWQQRSGSELQAQRQEGAFLAHVVERLEVRLATWRSELATGLAEVEAQQESLQNEFEALRRRLATEVRAEASALHHRERNAIAELDDQLHHGDMRWFGHGPEELADAPRASHVAGPRRGAPVEQLPPTELLLRPQHPRPTVERWPERPAVGVGGAGSMGRSSSLTHIGIGPSRPS